MQNIWNELGNRSNYKYFNRHSADGDVGKFINLTNNIISKAGKIKVYTQEIA